jgi:hypothetical protein
MKTAKTAPHVRLPCWFAKGGSIAAMGQVAFAVYMVLRSFAGQDERCYPSVATLAALSGVHGRGVRYALQRLVELGFVEVLRSKGGRPIPGHATTNVYRILPLAHQKMDARNDTLKGARNDRGSSTNRSNTSRSNSKGRGALRWPTPGAYLRFGLVE